MTLRLTEQQELIRNMAREFTMTEVIQKSMEGMKIYEETGQAPFGFGLWDRMAELGFAGIAVPEEYGGMGLGVFEEMLVLEEISKVNSAATTNIDAHNLCMNTIKYCGTEDQKQRYLVPGAQGKLIGAAAVTDPAGSSNFPEWGITAEEAGSDYVLNGTKVYCSNSIAAGLYAVYTKSSGGPGPMDCYLIEAGTPGLETGHLEVFGRSGTNTGTVHLKNVHVPKENKIPPADLFNSGWLALGYLDFSAIMIGVAEATLERTIAFTKQRSRGGRPLAMNQGVAHRLANMATQIELGRAIAYGAAELYDAGQMDRKLHSMAKIHTSEMITDLSIQCIALHGAAGCDPATGIWPAYTIAANSWSGEYPNDLHRDMIARELGITLDSLL